MSGRRRMAAMRRRLRRLGEADDELAFADVASSRGTPLDHQSRSVLEARYAHQFDDVAIHADGEAARLAGAIGARAFTVGRDIFLGGNAPALDTPQGFHLLAHEAAHAVQNAGVARASAEAESHWRVGTPGDQAEERAEHAAQQVMWGRPVDVGALQGSAIAGTAGDAGVVHCWPDLDLDLDWLGDPGSVLDAGLSMFAPGGGLGSLATSAMEEVFSPGSRDAGYSTPAQPPGAPVPGELAPRPAPADADPRVVDAAVGNLSSAMQGLGTDEAAIYRALRGKSPAEIAAIKAQFQATTGSSLEDALADEMSGTELEEAQAYLTGDKVKGAAAALANASAGLGTDEETIKSVLMGLPHDQRDRLRSEYAAKTGQSLDDMLDDELSGSDLDQARRQLRKRSGDEPADSRYWWGD